MKNFQRWFSKGSLNWRSIKINLCMCSSLKIGRIFNDIWRHKCENERKEIQNIL